MSAPEAGRGSSKKSPGIGTVAQICQAWAAAYSPQAAERPVALQLAEAAGPLKPTQLTELIPIALIERWRKTLAPSTAYGRTQHLKKLLRFLKDAGAADLSKHLPKVATPQPRGVTAKPQDLATLREKASAPLRLFIHLCSQLALRFTEAFELCPANYNREAGTIKVRVKGHRWRTLPITPEIKACLDAAEPTGADPMRPYVCILAGKDFGPVSLRKRFRQLIKQSGVDQRLNPHDLRRTTANLAYSLTKDIRAVQQLLGHSRLSSTAWYLTPLQPEDLTKLVQELRLPTKVIQ